MSYVFQLQLTLVDNILMSRGVTVWDGSPERRELIRYSEE